MIQNSDCLIPSEDYKESPHFLEVEQLRFTFEGKTQSEAIKNLKFQLAENKIHAIIGASGSGKSTLLKLISGLLQPLTGTIRFKGHRILGPLEKLVAGHPSMRLVSQNFEDLNLYANVFENVSSELSNSDLKVKNQKTKSILKQLNIHHLSQKRIFDLSGGEKQRVAIARALITKPEVLLMDEPFNQVDAAFRESLQEDIREIVKQSGITLILVSHDPAEVLSLADTLLVMKEGKIVAKGNPRSLFDNPPNSYTAKLLAKANILEPENSKILGIETNKKTLIHQHDLELTPDLKSLYYIAQIRFKGFYLESTIQHKLFPKFQLKCITIGNSELLEGMLVQLRVCQYQIVSN